MATYTKEQISERLAEWNIAALKLPANPVEGATATVAGFHFSCHRITDGGTGRQFLWWELLSSNWKPTGICWPAN